MAGNIMATIPTTQTDSKSPTEAGDKDETIEATPIMLEAGEPIKGIR
jgi:hypothetical protein